MELVTATLFATVFGFFTRYRMAKRTARLRKEAGKLILRVRLGIGSPYSTFTFIGMQIGIAALLLGQITFLPFGANSSVSQWPPLKMLLCISFAGLMACWSFAPNSFIAEFRQNGLLSFLWGMPIAYAWKQLRYLRWKKAPRDSHLQLNFVEFGGIGTAPLGQIEVGFKNWRFTIERLEPKSVVLRVPNEERAAVETVVSRFAELRDIDGIILNPGVCDAIDSRSNSATVPQNFRYQFDLMTLLFLTVVVSAGVAWYSTYLRRFEHEQRIVQRLERFQPYFNNDRMIDFSGSYNKPSDADMSIIAELPGVRWLGLFQAPITDAGLPAIGRLSNLEHLDLSFTAISDAGLPELENLHHLRTLSLVGTHVSEAGVKRLQKALPQCEISK